MLRIPAPVGHHPEPGERHGAVTVNRIELSNANNTGNISLSTGNGAITIAAGQAGVSTAGSGSIMLSAGGASGDVVIDQDVTSKAGGITISSGGQTVQHADISTTGGGVTVASAGPSPSTVATLRLAGRAT